MAPILLWIAGFACFLWALRDMILWRNEIAERERRQQQELEEHLDNVYGGD